MIIPHLFASFILLIHHNAHSFAQTLLWVLSILIFLHFHPNLQVVGHHPCIQDLISNIWQQHQLTLVHQSLRQRPWTTVCDEAPHRRVCKNQLLHNPPSIHKSFPLNPLFKPFWHCWFHCLKPYWGLHCCQEWPASELKTQHQLLELVWPQSALTPKAAIHHCAWLEPSEPCGEFLLQFGGWWVQNNWTTCKHRLVKLVSNVIKIWPFDFSACSVCQHISFIQCCELAIVEENIAPKRVLSFRGKGTSLMSMKLDGRVRVPVCMNVLYASDTYHSYSKILKVHNIFIHCMSIYFKPNKYKIVIPTLKKSKLFLITSHTISIYLSIQYR